MALKPQLWCGHAFTGDIVFSSDEEFGQWFAQYRAWMMHYAHLAEDEHADLLVVGTELGGLTVRQGAWRELIRDMRRVYSGPLRERTTSRAGVRCRSNHSTMRAAIASPFASYEA